MNPVILFWSIPFLAIITCLLNFYAQKLYRKYYESFISFEPISQFHSSFKEQASQICILLISFLLAPVLLWSQGQEGSSEYVFVCGFAIGFFASFISRSISSILVYKYVQKNSHLISGQAIFKIPAVQAIIAALVLQQFILITLLAFFMPSNVFIVGVIFGLGFLTFGNFFLKSKKADPTF